jgi:hypothetical protein
MGSQNAKENATTRAACGGPQAALPVRAGVALRGTNTVAEMPKKVRTLKL